MDITPRNFKHLAVTFTFLRTISIETYLQYWLVSCLWQFLKIPFPDFHFFGIAGREDFFGYINMICTYDVDFEPWHCRQGGCSDTLPGSSSCQAPLLGNPPWNPWNFLSMMICKYRVIFFTGTPQFQYQKKTPYSQSRPFWVRGFTGTAAVIGSGFLFGTEIGGYQWTKSPCIFVKKY